MTSVYDSQRLAAAYARDRPPIHEQILRAARLARQADQALDVGCGAGLSTAALAPLARQVVGLEPIPTMLAHRRTVAPQAGFVIGQAEQLPFATRSFDLVTAAGSLNYADLPSALAEIARVLTQDGTFLLYDFSVGRHSVSGDELARWFASFEQRFPWPPGWQPFDVRELPLAAYGLQSSRAYFQADSYRCLVDVIELLPRLLLSRLQLPRAGGCRPGGRFRRRGSVRLFRGGRTGSGR
jgi:ubiquinone/menaquinone biosynthesis C-methylase UbiE